MKWVEADFKGKTVWAQVHDGGNLVVEGGRIPIRYSDKEGAKIYRALKHSTVRELEDRPRARRSRVALAGTIRECHRRAGIKALDELRSGGLCRRGLRLCSLTGRAVA